MKFVKGSEDGPEVYAETPRRERNNWSPAQVAARRHAMWLHLVDVGMLHPRDKRVRPWTVAEVAGIFGVTAPTVYRGIEEARRTRNAFASWI
jgi:hypothetical protein